uniref:Uncharacterized protein n=1 Tax=Oryza glumipatula TaxID=40148 RepID=A0A0D9YWD5_9ORYZ
MVERAPASVALHCALPACTVAAAAGGGKLFLQPGIWTPSVIGHDLINATLRRVTGVAFSLHSTVAHYAALSGRPGVTEQTTTAGIFRLPNPGTQTRRSHQPAPNLPPLRRCIVVGVLVWTRPPTGLHFCSTIYKTKMTSRGRRIQ